MKWSFWTWIFKFSSRTALCRLQSQEYHLRRPGSRRFAGTGSDDDKATIVRAWHLALSAPSKPLPNRCSCGFSTRQVTIVRRSLQDRKWADWLAFRYPSGFKPGRPRTLPAYANLSRDASRSADVLSSPDPRNRIAACATCWGRCSTVVAKNQRENADFSDFWRPVPPAH